MTFSGPGGKSVETSEDVQIQWKCQDNGQYNAAEVVVTLEDLKAMNTLEDLKVVKTLEDLEQW